jgi:hypothetical protein
MNKIANTSVKVCNSYALILNSIWIFSSIIYIYLHYTKYKNTLKIKGKIVKIEILNQCKIKDNKKSFFNHFKGDKYHGILEIEYTINNEKKNIKIEHDKCKDLIIGGDIELLYNVNDKQVMIDQSNIYSNILYFVIIFLVIILFFTILRIFYSNNKWVKIYIAFQCLLPG